MYIEGLTAISNLEVLTISNNNITLDQQVINELLHLTAINCLNIEGNPLSENGYEIASFELLLSSKLARLQIFNNRLIVKNYE